MIDFRQKPWREIDLIAFDTETTDPYPLTAEVCELAGVKWRGGEIVGRFATLIKPSRPMHAAVIAIHGITNEMVAEAPPIASVIKGFHEFIAGGITIAHHAPFDLGFISYEFEKAGLALPPEPALCSSLLSRRLFPESSDHRLRTLIEFFKLDGGQAHRAGDDAKACLEVGLRCLQKCGENALLEQVIQAQGAELVWPRFSMRALEAREDFKILIQASREKRAVRITRKSGDVMTRTPKGLVRSLDGDYVLIWDDNDGKAKRLPLEKIVSVAFT